MDRGGKEICLHDAGHALRIEKNQAIEEFNFIRGADALVKIREVGAAAEGNVLAIVHMLAVRQNIGGRAAAEVGPLFEEPYPEPSVSQRDAGRQPRQPAANHHHVFRGHYPVCAARILRGR